MANKSTITRSDTFVVVKKGNVGSDVKYRLPGGAAVKRVDGDILRRASAKSEPAIRAAMSKHTG